MINTQELLCFLSETVQIDQHLLSVAIMTASSHGLKSLLGRHLMEYDRMESEIQETAASRGWELTDLQPAIRWNHGIRFRLAVRNRDGCIADRLVYMHTTERISLLRMGKLWDRSDEQVSLILQKLLDGNAIQIRQLEAYL